MRSFSLPCFSLVLGFVIDRGRDEGLSTVGRSVHHVQLGAALVPQDRRLLFEVGSYMLASLQVLLDFNLLIVQVGLLDVVLDLRVSLFIAIDRRYRSLQLPRLFRLEVSEGLLMHLPQVAPVMLLDLLRRQHLILNTLVELR